MLYRAALPMHPALILDNPWDTKEVHVPGYGKATISDKGEAVVDKDERLRLIQLPENTSNELRDGSGRIIGVTLGVGEAATDATDWAQYGGSSWHFEFTYGARPGSANRDDIEDPWQGNVGERPFYVVAHNSAVERTGGGIARVGGAAMALALLRSEEFRQAHRSPDAQPTAYVILACSMGRPQNGEGPAADLRRTLSYYGFRAPVVVATGVVELLVVHQEAETRAGTGIERGHHWVVYHDDQWDRPTSLPDQPPVPVVVQFSRKARRLTATDLAPSAQQLRGLAQALVDEWDVLHARNLGTSHATIVGYGNGFTTLPSPLASVSRRGEATGLARARQVHVHLSNLVRIEIGRRDAAWRLTRGLDDGATVADLVAQLVPSTVRGERGGERSSADEGRQVVVTIVRDQHPGGTGTLTEGMPTINAQASGSGEHTVPADISGSAVEASVLEGSSRDVRSAAAGTSSSARLSSGPLLHTADVRQPYKRLRLIQERAARHEHPLPTPQQSSPVQVPAQAEASSTDHAGLDGSAQVLAEWAAESLMLPTGAEPPRRLRVAVTTSEEGAEQGKDVLKEHLAYLRQLIKGHLVHAGQDADPLVIGATPVTEPSQGESWKLLVQPVLEFPLTSGEDVASGTLRIASLIEEKVGQPVPDRVIVQLVSSPQEALMAAGIAQGTANRIRHPIYLDLGFGPAVKICYSLPLAAGRGHRNWDW
jgi:hypothetical protein